MKSTWAKKSIESAGHLVDVVHVRLLRLRLRLDWREAEVDHVLKEVLLPRRDCAEPVAGDVAQRTERVEVELAATAEPAYSSAPNVATFLWCLKQGCTAAESFYHANRWINWMWTLFADPLSPITNEAVAKRQM